MLFLTETWLHSKHTDSMFCPPNFNVMRFDRMHGRGGGVLLLYRQGLQLQRIDVNFSRNHCYEVICVDLYLCNSSIRFCCVYLPPCQTSRKKVSKDYLPPASNAEVVENLCKTLYALLPTDKAFFLFGDFNLPLIDWNIPSATSNDRCHSLFLDFCSSHSLFQCIDYPTHEKGNTLDLLICNYNAKILLVNHQSAIPPWSTDHLLIHSKISCEIFNTISSKDTTRFPNFKSADYTKISRLLQNLNWDFLYSSIAPQVMYDKFCSLITLIIDSNIPLTSNYVKKNNPRPLHIRNLCNEKHRLYNKSKVDKSYKRSYKEASKQYDLAVSRWHDALESRLCSDPSRRKLYSFINSKLKSKHCIPALEDDNGNLVFSDIDKANTFNAAFQSFFTMDNNTQCHILPPRVHMPDFEITSEDILKACNKMKRKLTRTPEGIPSFFIANTIGPLLLPLTVLFNIFLSNNVVPVQWKQAFVIPVFKKGDRSKVGNYRPISLTSSIARLFESVILDKLIAYTQQNNLISELQFGFQPNRSTCDNILQSLHSWLDSYSSFKSTNILYTDIKKAFDSVNHRILIEVLYSFGLNTSLVKWISNFLSNRQQRVCINSSISSALPVLSGVPQGSVIGPFLFLLFFNGITDVMNASQVNFSLFADDSKLFCSDPQILQSAISNVNKWLSDRQLHLAPHKCAILKVKKKSITDSSSFHINGHVVEELSSLKDLGILVTSDLSWSSHINRIYTNAAVTSYQIFKTVKTRNIWTWTNIFNTYILPKIEFNTPVWSPHLKGDIDKLENIQRRFTRVAFNRCRLPRVSYETRLSMLGILSLSQRRSFLDLVLMYKIINRLCHLNFDDYFTLNIPSYDLRSHPLQIRTKLKHKSPQWLHSFFTRILSLWNNLPVQVVAAESLNIFKSLLKHHLKNVD